MKNLSEKVARTSKKRIALVILVILFFGYACVDIGYNIAKNETSSSTKLSRNDESKEKIDPYTIANLVNDKRIEAGVGRLSINPLAEQAAKEKCADMVANDYYDHLNPKTKEHGYQYAINLISDGTWFNENLNQGNVTTNEDFVDSWMDSPSHKANMLDPRFTDTGVAVCHIPSEPSDSLTIVQEFVEIEQ